MVSDNGSTGNTRDIVSSCFELLPGLRYYANERNLGPDCNIAKCFDLACADYAWISSGDDLLLPRAIKRILLILRSRNLGIIALAVNFYPEKGVIDESWYPCEPLSFTYCHDPRLLACDIYFWLAYVTGVITNNRVALECGIAQLGEDSFLIQLGWVMPALFSTLPSAKVESPLILGRALETLDFKLLYIFGSSYSSVLKKLSRIKVLPPEVKDTLIDLVIRKYFVHYIRPRSLFPCRAVTAYPWSIILESKSVFECFSSTILSACTSQILSRI